VSITKLGPAGVPTVVISTGPSGVSSAIYSDGAIIFRHE
jgi:hypothetical protein